MVPSGPSQACPCNNHPSTIGLMLVIHSSHMFVTTLQTLDRWLGVPLCSLLTGANWLFGRLKLDAARR